MLKKFKFLIVFAITTLLIYSCTKEAAEELKPPLSIAFLSSNMPYVVNDMLHFDGYDDFEKFVNDLKIQEQDTLALKTAYIELGFNLEADSLPNLTEYPICLITEQSFSGFTSARKGEEEIINSALNNGEDVFSIVDNPYLKTALNLSNAVHIGTRIFKFFDNGGIVIVLNDNWETYTSIKSLPFNSIKQTSNVIVTSDAKKNWSRFYNLDETSSLLGEKEYEINPPVSENVMACDFSDQLVVTTLNNGNIRIDFPHNTPYDIYEWTFEDGSHSYDYPLIIDCSEVPSGVVSITLWNDCPSCPSGIRRICVGEIKFECSCGEKKIRKETGIWTVNGQTWKIDASIWVQSGEVGCKMRYLRKIWFAWLPAYNQAVCTDIGGTYVREGEDGACLDVSYVDIKCLGSGTFPISVSVTQSDISDIFREPNALDSGHRVRVSGTWFGFGVGSTPRLVLD